MVCVSRFQQSLANQSVKKCYTSQMWHYCTKRNKTTHLYKKTTQSLKYLKYTKWYGSMPKCWQPSFCWKPACYFRWLLWSPIRQSVRGNILLWKASSSLLTWQDAGKKWKTNESLIDAFLFTVVLFLKTHRTLINARLALGRWTFHTFQSHKMWCFWGGGSAAAALH